MVLVLKEIEGLGEGAVLADELYAVFFWAGRLHDFVHYAESFEWVVAIGHEGFPDVVAGKFFFFEYDDVVAVLGKNCGCGGTSRSTSYNDYVRHRGVSQLCWLWFLHRLCKGGLLDHGV